MAHTKRNTGSGDEIDKKLKSLAAYYACKKEE
jgi:hypothetical protein